MDGEEIETVCELNDFILRRTYGGLLSYTVSASKGTPLVQEKQFLGALQSETGKSIRKDTQGEFRRLESLQLHFPTSVPDS